MKRWLATLAIAVLCAATPVRAQSSIFTLDAHDVELPDLIRLLAAQSGRNVIADATVKPVRVTLRMNDVDFDEALATIVDAYGLQTHRDGRTLIVGEAASMNRRFGDDASPGGTQSRVFVLSHARPDEAAVTLQAALPPGTVVVADRRTNAILVTGSPATMLRAQAVVHALDIPVYGPGGPGGTLTIPLHNLRASEAAKSLKGVVPDNALFTDDRQNVVVVNGNAEVRATVVTLLEALDAPSRQVEFDVRVADVQPLNDQIDVGVQFGGTGYDQTGGALGAFPYALTKSSVVVNAQINALVQHGKATIVAQPRITTLNNHEASLLIGSQYPVVTVNQQTGYPSVQTIDVGVRLRLTPIIGDDGTITADLHPEYSEISGFNASFPIIANRKIDATLRVHDGETIVLGGLFEDIDSETITKFPLLGDLPVLGGLFRNRQRSHTKDEVLFFITPHIVGASAGDAVR
jgi:type II secretory pathway component GspD/PulD (secretin)